MLALQGRNGYAQARKELDRLAEGTPGRGLIHPQQVAKAISDLAASDAVFACDVGLPTVWATRYLAMNGQFTAAGSNPRRRRRLDLSLGRRSHRPRFSGATIAPSVREAAKGPYTLSRGDDADRYDDERIHSLRERLPAPTRSTAEIS